MARRRLQKRYNNRRNRSSGEPAYRRNPGELMEIVGTVLPGFGGFAATQLLTRMATVQTARRKPSWAKHVGALVSVGSVALSWWGAPKVKQLEKHSTAITIGAAIAAMKSIIQLYIPKLGWMLGDPTPEAADMAIPATQQQQIAATVSKLTPIDDDPAFYTFDDKYDAGLYANQTGAPSPAPSSAATKAAKEDQILADLNLDDSSNLGIFSN